MHNNPRFQVAAEADRLFSAGEYGAALEHLVSLAQAEPRNPQVFLMIGACHTALDNSHEAIRALRRCLKVDTRYWPAEFNLGDLLERLGRLDEALGCYRRCLNLEPGNEKAAGRIADILQRKNGPPSALEFLRSLGQFLPGSALLQAKLAEVQVANQQVEAAITIYRDLLRQQPGQVEYQNNLAMLLDSTDHYAEAGRLYRECLASGQAEKITYANYIGWLLRQGNLDEALAWNERLGQRFPGCFDYFVSLARIQAAQGQFHESQATFDQAIQADPGLAAELLAGQAAADRIQDAYPRRWDPRAALLFQGLDRLRVCCWEGYSQWRGHLEQGIREAASDAEMPDYSTLKAPLPAELKLRIDRARSRRIEAHVAGLGWRAGHHRDSWRGQRIRVGYISADFREHAVGLLIKDLFSRHDRRGFEIYAYDLWTGRKDKISAEIARGVDRYRELQGQTNVAAARRIEADKIQILVDLMGYTAHGRPEILALRPAPVQINYLGYPGSLGAEYMDYIVGTELLIPREHQALYDEQIIRLPHSHNIVGRWPEPGRRPDREELGLPAGVPVVAAFGGADKLDPGVFDVWMRILGRVADSRLWLYAKSPDIERNLSQAAGSRGIDPRRLIFASRVDPDAHLARLGAADLYLDTRIYSGFTTIAMALWAGLPVLSCLGDGYGTRMGAVAVQAAGLGELVVDDWQAYEDLAVALLGDPDRLAGLRRRLETDGRRSPLFDQAGYTRHLEQAYTQAWALYAAGEAPRPIWIPA
jgi:predicted O-linked N-acetylglucosamine transferase (SPINDLY family)